MDASILAAIRACNADTYIAQVFRRAAGIKCGRKPRRNHRKLMADADEDYERLMRQRIGAMDRA